LEICFLTSDCALRRNKWHKTVNKRATSRNSSAKEGGAH
jgi:hypothetical protein